VSTLGFREASVGAAAIVPRADASRKPRVLTGAADGSVVLWDHAGGVLAVLETGDAATAVHAPTPRAAFVGTQGGNVEVLALSDPAGPEADETLTRAAVDAGEAGPNEARNEVVRYAPKHDAGGAAASSFDAFTRRVPIREGAFVDRSRPESAAAKQRRSAAGSAEREAAKRAMRDLGSAESTRAREEAEKKRVEEAEREKHRAMDEKGVARDAGVVATSEATRRCSNPTCVEREDTIAGRMARCGRCKLAAYCSAHCQRTHWRDGHKEE